MSIDELTTAAKIAGLLALAATMIYLSMRVRRAQKESKPTAIEARTSGMTGI